MNKRSVGWVLCGCLLMSASVRAPAQTAAEPIGLFAGHTDVGTVLHPGSILYDAARHSYTTSGSGENVWATADAFQFVWKKMEGDFTLSADISILGQGGDPHKKALLMARQSLDADSAYADVALHAAGLASLQSRDAKGADTHEIQSNISAPKKLRLQKYGDEFTMWIAGNDGKFQMAGGSMRVPMTGPFYVGLGVCAHNKDAVETAEFGKVALGPVVAGSPTAQYGTLETITVASTDRRVTYVGSPEIGDPNFAPDGVSLVFSQGGQNWRVPVAGGEPQVFKTGFAAREDDYHGLSPDGTMLAFTKPSTDRSEIYVAPIRGGEPRRVTAAPHACCPRWSPDGKTIVFMGSGQGEFNIFTVPVVGGEGTRLTTEGVNLGAEYSPDGRYIYFNSGRSIHMEAWRMRPDGSEAEQLVKDDASNWFPHVSPDGRLLAFLTIPGDDSGFPAAFAPAMLRVMTLADGHIRVLAKLTAARRTMRAWSWSPDSQRIAFISHQGVKAGDWAP